MTLLKESLIETPPRMTRAQRMRREGFNLLHTTIEDTVAKMRTEGNVHEPKIKVIMDELFQSRPANRE